MDFREIMVAGSGVLGSQIAFQTAFHGFDVTIYDINNEAIDHAKKRLKVLKIRYRDDLKSTQKKVDDAYNRITYSTDLKKAVSDVDLIIEAIPEVIKIKEEFYKKIGKWAQPHTIFASNSSTFLPSQFADISDRPDKFIALHFANTIWLHNTAEIMGHKGTDPKVFNAMIEFAELIGMVPIPIYKEQSGYLLNSLLIPFLEAGLKLITNGISDVESIDKTWRIGTGSPNGPLETIDIIGMKTVYNILAETTNNDHDKSLQKCVDFIKKYYIDEGKLGIESGEGFYRYIE